MFAGTYGDLLLRADGSYTYTATRADAVATGTTVNDVFAYQVGDGHGGASTPASTCGPWVRATDAFISSTARSPASTSTPADA